ncbi:MAG TPA: transposase [Candidatus Lustribacter sp.]|nr:transposase [Candidatus Lustribacter sp.]
MTSGTSSPTCSILTGGAGRRPSIRGGGWSRRCCTSPAPAASGATCPSGSRRGRRSGPTFHAAGGRGGRTFGAKRSILVEILVLPLAVRVDPARPHDVVAGRELLADRLPELPRVRAVVADRAYRGLARLAARRQLALDIKVPPPGTSGFVPLRPLYRVEHAFAQLGRWRRLSRCYEGTAASARAWLEVAAMGYLFARLRVEPA